VTALGENGWIGRAKRRIAAAPWNAAAFTVAMVTIALVVWTVTRSWLTDLSTFGFHDWDSQTAHRELVRKTLLEHHELPWWNPYACGGFPAWGYVESDTVLVSPWLPAYLLLPMSVALRVEVVGMALLAAIGAYLLASRFTESHAARALVVALWAVNGRWGLQTAVGHTWHLAYAYLPWCFYFFERARSDRGRTLDVAAAGLAFAMLVYAGGIYPLPHTVLVLGLYAVGVAIAERSLRPLVVLGLAGTCGVGLSAPKLLPVLRGFQRAPRLIDSTESMDLGALVTMLTSRDQNVGSHPARVSPYGWHEWGMYISAAGVATLVAAFILVRGKRETALKVVGAILILLGFGAFHPSAPWTWLHAHVPVFKSQHVPSRFLYPAVLVLALVAAAGLGRVVHKVSLRRRWFDAALGLGVMALAVDVAGVSALPMSSAMWMVPPDGIPNGRPFHFEQEPPLQYKKRDWAGPMYLAMLANTGVINCYGAPPFDGKGAKPVRDPAYRGEVFVDGADAKASVATWSPNRVVAEVDSANDGARLVYNMNFDAGWTAALDSGASLPLENAESRVATRVPKGKHRVIFRYRPQSFGLGMGLFAVTVALLFLARRRERRSEAGA